MKLTDTAIRKTKPTDAPQKIRDGRELYLLIRPDGAKTPASTALPRDRVEAALCTRHR